MDFDEFIKIIKEGDISHIEKFIRRNSDKINQTNSEGKTYLMVACELGNTDVTKLLIKFGADLDKRGGYGKTALYYAVRGKTAEVVANLISAGVDLTVRTGHDDTVLHVAAAFGNKDVVEVILKTLGGDTRKINQRNNRRLTPLHFAVENDDPDVVRTLISAGADLTVQDGDGDTLLHRAARRGNKDVVEVILKKLGGDTLKINQRNNLGATPLHFAVAKNTSEVVRMLIYAGADLTVQDGYCDTVLHWAARWGNKDVVDVILKTLGGDTLKINQRNNLGSTPLHLAVAKNTAEVVSSLISAGADLTIQDGDDDTVLHVAARRGNKDVEVILKATGEDTVKYCTNLELSRTQRLCGAGVASYLADNGANLYHRNNNKIPLDLIRNPELKRKIEVLFPPPCMLCENNMATIKFQPCGHNVICGKCSKIELKRCPKCRECIISKTGFETPESNDKEVQTMPQPVETPESNNKEVPTRPQRVETPESNNKEVPTRPQRVETPESSDKGVPNRPQRVEMRNLTQHDLQNVSQTLASKWQQVGRNLGIKNFRLENIKYDNPFNVVEQSFQMLYKWFTRCDAETRTADTLRDALLRTECFDALEFLPLDIK